jgi:hypothetical protein
MDDRRHENTMSDDLIDRELDALLSAEPSPEFVARVRMRVSSEPLARLPWSATRWIVVAVTVIVAVAAMIGLWTLQPAHVAVEQARVAAPAVAPIVQPQDAGNSPLPRPMPPRPASGVLISPSESRVVERLLIAARGTAVVPAAPASEEGDAALLPPMPIAIEPITVEPLAAVTNLEPGVDQ